MGYPELARALHEETQRQLAELAAQGASAAATLIDEARRAAAAARDAALARDDGEAREEARRHVARLHLEEERALLVESRRLLERVAGEASRVLDGKLDEALALRLAGELLAELDGPGWTLRVDPAHVAAVRARAGAAVEVTAGAPGDLAATAGGRTLDNRPRARLASAWADLEPALCRRLFEEGQP